MNTINVLALAILLLACVTDAKPTNGKRRKKYNVYELPCLSANFEDFMGEGGLFKNRFSLVYKFQL